MHMPTTEELLAQLEAEAQSETPVCVIDPETRTITVPPEYQLLGVENDKRVERIYFQCPKIVGDNQDLSQDYILFINYVNANGDPDAYKISDMQVDGDNITFSWLLEENVTKYRGSIQFAFGAIIPGDEAEDPDKNRWNTTINTDCTCLVGLKCTQQVAESNPDALAQIWAAIDELKLSGGGGGTSDYERLSNQPKINGVTLVGNKTAEELELQPKGDYLTRESDPTVPQWAKNPTKPTYTATEVGADASGTANTKVSEHNVSEEAHNDIRLLVQGLTQKLNTLADSDDDTLDQLSEIVTYIKNNKSLIDGITTSKVNVSDIINNLITNVSNKPLSAAQGVVLKSLIDEITIPEKLPNPYKLTFSGAVTGEYDGSAEQNIVIPKSSGGSYVLPIMSDTQLGGGKAVPKTEENVPVAVDPETGQLFVPKYPEIKSGIAVKQMQNTDTAVTLPGETPYDLYIFPEMTELSVTIADTDQEVHLFFDSGATATVFSLQSQGGGQIYTDAYSIEANMRYEVSVLHNVAYIKGGEHRC